MKELTLPATIENIEKVTDFVNAQLEEIECPMKAQMQIDIAIDELFGNIAHYAYNPETGPATVRVEVTGEPISVIITFIDHGVPYDPLKQEDPDISLSAEERSIEDSASSWSKRLWMRFLTNTGTERISSASERRCERRLPDQVPAR